MRNSLAFFLFIKKVMTCCDLYVLLKKKIMSNMYTTKIFAFGFYFLLFFIFLYFLRNKSKQFLEIRLNHNYNLNIV